MSFLTIYSSSAGSGKTYTLAKEYLKLVLGDASEQARFNKYYYRNILAVTFTNDAANEMKERILSYLYGFAEWSELDQTAKKKLQPLLTQVTEEINALQSNQLTERDIQWRAREVFRNIIHDYASFSVSTIDSFTQRIVSAFTEELGIPYNFEVSLEADILLEAAVQQLLNKVGAEHYESLTKIMTDFTQDMAQEGGNWNRLAADIANFARILLEDKHHERVAQLHQLEPKDFLTINRQLSAYLIQMEAQAHEWGKRAFAEITRRNLEAKDFFQSNRGIYTYFKKWAEKPDFVANEPNSYVQQAVQEDKWYGGKTPLPIQETIDEIKDYLSETVDRIEHLRRSHLPRFKVYQLLKKHLPKLALLKQLSQELETLEDSTNAVHISKFNRKILDIVLNEPIPFIYERLGEKYYHILIDEFQDTSVLQWTNFMPLIDNSLAYERKNLLVGDAKQSIYRFRGGEMEQIVYLHRGETSPLIPENDYSEVITERYFNIERNINPQVLQTNYRSAQEIIEFNNDFFELITQNYNTDGALVGKAYSDFRQLTHGGTKSGGHVEIDFLPKTDADSEDEVTLNRVWELVQQLVREEGFRPKDIAVLCRKNKQSGKVANFLKDRYFEYEDGRRELVEIVSQDSLSLSFSEAINLVTSVMWVILSPVHELAQYEALYLFHKIVLKQIPDTQTNQSIREIVNDTNPNTFFEHLKEKGVRLDPFKLQQAGLYELAEELIGVFRLFERSHETPYLFRFLDVVHDFSLRQSNQLSDFLDYWDKKKTALSIITEADRDAVTITSVHKSKGLEYPVVIIPYANWKTTPDYRDRIWAELSPEQFPELSLEATAELPNRHLAVGTFELNSKLEQTPIEPLYEHEKELTFLDNLNSLYVALTRPTMRLYVLVPAKDPEKLKGNVGELFYQYVQAKGLYQPDQGIFVINEGKPNAASNQPNQQEVTLQIPEIISYDRTDKVRLRHQAERVFDLETFELSKDWGNKVHSAFSQIRAKEDIPEAIQDMVFKGEITPSESKELREKIEKILQLPELENLYSGSYNAENEREILLPNSQLRPDRVVFLPDKVVILDYKTGAPKDSHQEQIKRYARLFHQMEYPIVEAKLIYIESEEVKRVDV
ncbi:MAG: UvrD-helicase domain-containing protein [Spirosomataceae bacterium]